MVKIGKRGSPSALSSGRVVWAGMGCGGLTFFLPFPCLVFISPDAEAEDKIAVGSKRHRHHNYAEFSTAGHGAEDKVRAGRRNVVVLSG